MKRFVIALTVLILLACPLMAEKQLREISWESLKDAPWGEYGSVIPAKDGQPARLVIENPRNEIATIPILTIENPSVGDVRWALHGKIRYQNVRGKGYVEMWSHFPNGGASFSRTLAASGPLQSLSGSSDWRTMSLPFYNDHGKTRPVKLTVNLRLPGSGKVELEPLTLWEYTGKENPLTPPGAWWSDTAAGWIGGIGGAAVGLSGALIGVMCSLGRGKRFILSFHVFMLALGIASVIVGLIALMQKQPYGVWYPLVLLGGIPTVVFGSLFFTVRQRFLQIELRKMQAMDA